MFLYIKKSERIEAFSIRKETSGFIHEECFDTHISKSVLTEGNAVGMVPRLALKTRFSDKGMEFDSSAFRQILYP